MGIEELFMEGDEPFKKAVYRGDSGTSVVVSRAAATANDRAVEGKEPFMQSRLMGARAVEGVREALYGGI